MKALPARARALVYRALRRLLLRLAAAPPRAGQEAGAEQRVTILLVSAWGMGGTIRAAHNLAGYLAGHMDVEIVSVYRRRDEPFFGAFPPGVRALALDDQRPGASPGGLWRPVRALLRRQRSVLVHPADRLAAEFNLWTDVQLVRRLRRSTGFVLGTRPALNLMLGQIDPPGCATIGLEQMHLRHHGPTLRRAMRRWYQSLDAFVVLTGEDAARYDRHLRGRVPIARIPNTVHEMGGPEVDPASKTILAAGRLRRQKGFDMLIEAYAPVAAAHPDWHLRICGEGRLRGLYEGMIEELGLGDAVSLPGPTDDMGATMAQASMFVLSSRFEGFPLILLEAMSKGLAVVSFDCPTGPADIVDDHRNGLLVPAKDVEALTRGMLEMIEDSELRRRCSEAAVETGRNYMMEAVGPRWDELFAGLAEERWGRRPAVAAQAPARAGA